MFYIITIAAATVLITVANFLLGGALSFPSLAKMLLLTLLCVIFAVAIDGILAFIIRRLPEKWFSPEAKAFSVGKWERNLYRRSKIHIWKKYVPEWGCFTGFHKDKLRSPNDSDYVARFLLESNYGVAGHVAGAVFGFALLFIPFFNTLTVALPVAVINLIMSLLPTAVLRSNTPALRGLYRRNLAREKREKETEKV